MSSMSVQEALQALHEGPAAWLTDRRVEALAVLRQAVEERDALQKAVQSHHDYGPASPGEQEAAWQFYCKGIGWDSNAHPAAKNAFCEGFCMGDLFSDGDEPRATLRAENERLRSERDEFKRAAGVIGKELTEATAEICGLMDREKGLRSALEEVRTELDEAPHDYYCKGNPCTCWKLERLTTSEGKTE